MTQRSFSTTAVTAHILKGLPITRIEAMCYYGMQDLSRVISRMRKAGHEIDRETISLESAIKSIQKRKVVTLMPPKNLPMREIMVARYRIVKK